MLRGGPLVGTLWENDSWLMGLLGTYVVGAIF